MRSGKLFIWENNDKIILLEKSLRNFIQLQKIDIRKYNLEPFIERDLGSTNLPILVTSDGIWDGYDKINEYCEDNSNNL